MAAPVFDNAVISSIVIGTNPTTTGSVGITVGAASDEYMFVDIIATNGGSQHWVPGSATATITCGGKTFTALGSVLIGNVDVAGFIWRFGVAGVPAGAQTVSVSLTEVGQQFGQAWILATSYTGVGSVGAFQSSFGVSASPLLAIPSATGHLVSAVIADYASGVLSSFSLTTRENETANVPFFVSGDGAGASSVSVSAANSAGAHWAVVGNDMLPVTPTNVTVTPGPAVVAVTGAPATVTATNNKTVTPGGGPLAVAGGTPVVTATNNKTVTPGAGVVALVGGSPGVAVTNSKTVTPGAGVVALPGGTPSVTATANKTVTPGAASVSVIGSAPTILNPRTVAPGGAPLAVVGGTPVVTVSSNKVITPGGATVAVAGGTPAVTATTNVKVAPGAAVVAVAGGTPTVTHSGNTIIRPGAAVVALAGSTPTVTIAPAPTHFVDYGYAESELCWGTASPQPIDHAAVTRICEGIRAVGGSRVRIGVQVGSQDDLDFAINTATAAGLKVLLCILGNPTFGYTSGPASYADECKFLALRYGPSGTNQVTEYELWNEENNAFNGPQVSAANYLPYLKAGYTAIHSVHASATVMPGGTVPTTMVWFGWATDPVEWYTELYAGGAKDFMDALAMHLYCDLPALPTPDMRQWKYMTDVRALMIANGDAAKKIWITEVGTSNPGPGITTPVIERDYLKAMVDGILSYDWMGPFFVYSFHDTGPDTTDALASNYGIVNWDFTPKSPKYEYCQSIAGMAANPLDRTPPSAPTGLAVTTDGLATWLPSTDDVGVTVYRIYDTVTNVMLCHTAQVGQTSIVIPSPTPGARMVVYATALDAAGNESARSDTAEFTAAALPGAQQAFAANFALLPSVPSDFTQVGWGFHVAAGLALPNVPTTEGDWYTIAPYIKDLQTPDHYCEITQGAASAYPDRYAMAGCRVSPDGTQGVFAFISGGGGQDDAVQIITIDGGVVTMREARNATPLLPGQTLRITPSGNVYTVERYVNGVATELVSWTDGDGSYGGVSNHRAAPAWRHKLVGGIYYPPNGIATWRAADTRAATTTGTGGTEAWTYAIIKPGKLGRVIATGLWETAI